MPAEKKLFLLTTNIPGSGKSTVGKAIEQVAADNHLRTYTINEFKLFGEWLGQHSTEVTWGPDEGDGAIVNLTPQQYADVFDYVQDKMVDEFLDHYQEVDIIISEAARDVSGVSYVPLFEYLIKELGDLTDFVDLDVYVDNIKELKRRVRKRAEKQPNSASVAVVNLYLKDMNKKTYPHSTSTATAAMYPDNFIFAGHVDNTFTDKKAVEENRVPDHLLTQIDGILAQVLALRASKGDDE